MNPRGKKKPISILTPYDLYDVRILHRKLVSLELNTHLPGVVGLKRGPGKGGKTADPASVPAEAETNLLFNFHLPNAL